MLEAKTIQQYTNSNYQEKHPFPQGVEAWNEEFARQYVEAVWAKFTNNGCYTSPQLWNDWSMNRLYGAGKQPEDIYYSWLKGSKKYPAEISNSVTMYDGDWTNYAKKTRKAWNNVDFTVHSFIPKIKGAIKGLLADVDYIVKAQAVDPFSKDEEENNKWKSYVFSTYQGYLLEQASKFNVPLEDMQFVPESLEELELHASAEGFKVNWAIVMDKLLRFTFDISDYEKEKEMWIDDLLDNGMCGSHDYIDKDTHLVKHGYIDPKVCVVQYSQRQDFSDSQYAGHVEMIPFSIIRSCIPEEKHEKLNGAMKAYAGIYGNAPESEWDNMSVVDEEETWKIGMSKALVFNCSWIADEYEFYKEYTTKYGTKRSKRITQDEYRKTNPENARKYPKRRLFHAKWVVGTDLIYDFGMVYNQPKSKYGREVRLDYHFYALPYKALVPTLKPLADDFQKAWLTYQNGLATGFKDGMALNVHMLKNVSLNGQAAKVEDVVEFLKETGVLPYSYSFTGQYKGGAASPLTPFQGMAANVIQNALMRMDFIYRQVAEVTGINPLSMGSNPTSSTQVGTAEIGYQATLNVLKPIIRGCFDVKESIGKNAVYRIQNAVTYDSAFETAYSGILSQNEIMLLKEAEKNGCQYAIALNAKPNRDHVFSMLDSIKQAFARQEISVDDYMFVLEQTIAGVDIGRIRQYISFKAKKTQQRLQQEAMQRIDQQNAGLAQIQQQKSEMDMQQTTAKIEGKLAEIDRMYRGEIEKKFVEIEGRLKEVVQKAMMSR